LERDIARELVVDGSGAARAGHRGAHRAEHLPELGEHRSELGGAESAGATGAAPAEGAAGAERSAGSPRAGARVVAGRVVVVAPVVVGGGESEGLVHATTVQARPGCGPARRSHLGRARTARLPCPTWGADCPPSS